MAFYVGLNAMNDAVNVGKDMFEMSFVQVAVLFEMGVREKSGMERYGAGGLKKQLLQMGAERTDEAMKQLLRRMVSAGLVSCEDGENEDGDLVKRYGVTELGEKLGKDLVKAMSRWGFGTGSQDKVAPRGVSAPSRAIPERVMKEAPRMDRMVSDAPDSSDDDEEEEELSEVRRIVAMIEGGGQPDYEEQVTFNRFNSLAAGFVNRKFPRDIARENAFCQMEQERK